MNREAHDPDHVGAVWAPALVGEVFASQGLCGRSFDRGLLRFHDATSGAQAQDFVDRTFGPTGVRAEVFAFDWLARQFAVARVPREAASVGDADPGPDSGPDPAPGTELTVVVLDPFDMTVLPWWIAAAEFEDAMTVEIAQDFLLPEIFDEWLAVRSLDALPFDHCAGANVPAFQGGERTIDNLPLNDLDTYFDYTAHLWGRVQP